MTAAYLRAKRDGKWQPLEVEYLTDEERLALFKDRSPEELIRWMNLLCKYVAEAFPEVKK